MSEKEQRIRIRDKGAQVAARLISHPDGSPRLGWRTANFMLYGGGIPAFIIAKETSWPRAIVAALGVASAYGLSQVKVHTNREADASKEERKRKAKEGNEVKEEKKVGEKQGTIYPEQSKTAEQETDTPSE